MKFTPTKKWGLFFVLAGSLGFSVSMNPQHFNNISRYQKLSVHSLDLAQKADPSEVSEIKASSREILVGGSKGNFKAKVYKVEDSTVVRFNNLDKEVEGKACDLCGQTFVLKSDFKDITDINVELLALANGSTKKSGEVSTEDEEVKVQVKGEATEVDLEAWAAKCDKASESAKLSCHKTRLIELSKYLKNSSDNSSLVYDYYKEYLKSDIRAGFNNPTVKFSIAANGYGVMQPSTDEDSSLLEESNELTETLIRSLQSKNGKKTIEDLTKMRAASFTAQLAHSQNLMKQGISEGNSYKFQIGLQGMNPDYQRQILQQSTQSMLDAVSDMKGTSAEKSAYSQYVSNNMYAPVDNVLNQLKNFVLNGNGSGTGNSDSPFTQRSSNGQHGFTDFVIPSLDGSILSIMNTQQVVDTNLSTMTGQRRGDDIRGANVQFGTGEGALMQRMNPPAARDQSNASQFVPGRNRY